MKIYTSANNDSEYMAKLQQNLVTKEILDQFVGTDYWVKCKVDRCFYIDLAGNEQMCRTLGSKYWVKFLEPMGTFYKVYLCAYYPVYEGTVFDLIDLAHVTKHTYTIELFEINLVEPMEIMPTDDLFLDEVRERE